MDLTSWLGAVCTSLDGWMAPLFLDAWPESFAEPMRYPVFGGGKRVRPALCVAAYQAIAGPDAPLERVLPVAAALELVHTYSLVHDDLPAMDDDDERRGRPTVHVAYGEATAILAGDALLTEAFRLVLTAEVGPAALRVRLVERLSDAAGYRGMIGGQVADIQGVSDHDALVRLHRCKTGALIQAACAMGAWVAGADATQAAALEAYGAAVGLAFQLADDVLDADEDAEEGGPPSFVKLLGVDETRRRAHELAEEAIGAVAELPHPGALHALARFTVERSV